MKIGVIDVGSNTVRIVVYKIDGENISEIVNERQFVGLIEFVDKGVLNYDGVIKLMEALKAVKELIEVIKCDDVYCFATASLRNVKNKDDVVFKVRNELGFDMQVISSEEEIFYDYVGIKRYVDGKCGVGLDLGGGSCQLFSFFNDKIDKSASFKIGSLLIYKSFVDGLLPKKSEIKKIKEAVKKELGKDKSLKGLGFEKVYAIGGSARAAAKLHRAMIGGDKIASNYQLTVEQIDDIIKTIYKMDIKGISFICHVIPERVYTIIPGLIVLRTVCKYIGAKKIQTVKGSVREGYLWEKVLKKSCSLTEN